MKRFSLGLVTVLPLCGLTLLLAATPVGADLGDCGQPVSTGGAPTATDALFALRSAVGVVSCELLVCDVDGSCAITAGDALRTLLVATGQSLSLDCETCGATTTTTVTSTTTSTLPEPAATWSDVRAIFSTAGCAVSGCHGSSNPSGGLGNLTNENSGYTELLNEDVFCGGSSYGSRVVPGSPDSSFLVAKIEGFYDCGSPMPLVGSLAPEDLDAIRSWILDGAQKN
jgi:hypothetical protein